MNAAIVITSVRGREAWGKWEHVGLPLYVVVDEKTPETGERAGTRIITLEEQRDRWPRLDELSRRNHYSRKNFGYLAAAADGHDMIFETDDDNEPLFGPPDFERALARFEPVRLVSSDERSGHLNWLQVGRGLTWAHQRGCPHYAATTCTLNLSPGSDLTDVAVWHFACLGEPDVDAVTRATSTVAVWDNDDRVLRRGTWALAPGTFTSWNSQSTLWDATRAGDLMYLPAYTTMRVTDVLRSWLASCELWGRELTAAECDPLVRQAKRNAHICGDDLLDEIPLYQAWERTREAWSEETYEEALRVAAKWPGVVRDLPRELDSLAAFKEYMLEYVT